MKKSRLPRGACASLAVAFLALAAVGDETRFARFVPGEIPARTHLANYVAGLPDFVLRNLVLLHDSASAQSASLTSSNRAPRAIVWDTQGRFFAGFNGAPENPGFDQLETLQYDEAASPPRFRYGGYDFDRGTSLAEKSCLGCHGARARPIWDEYPRWPGAYGSREDLFAADEAAPYQDFRAGVGATALYAPLFRGELWDHYPYKYDPDTRVMSEPHTFKYRPNTRMAVLLNRLNARRVLAILKANPAYTEDRTRLAALFLGCLNADLGWPTLRPYGLTARDLDLRRPYYDPAYAVMAFDDSYFDGASTTNELLAAAIVADLPTGIRGLARFRTLARLYDSNYHRQNDAEFMAAADELGAWIRTPFPEWQAKAKLRPRPNALDIDSVATVCRALTAGL